MWMRSIIRRWDDCLARRFSQIPERAEEMRDQMNHRAPRESAPPRTPLIIRTAHRESSPPDPLVIIRAVCRGSKISSSPSSTTITIQKFNSSEFISYFIKHPAQSAAPLNPKFTIRNTVALFHALFATIHPPPRAHGAGPSSPLPSPLTQLNTRRKPPSAITTA